MSASLTSAGFQMDSNRALGTVYLAGMNSTTGTNYPVGSVVQFAPTLGIPIQVPLSGRWSGIGDSGSITLASVINLNSDSWALVQRVS